MYVDARMRVSVLVLFEHEPVSQEEKRRTRIDGRNKEEKENKEKWRRSAQAEYDFAEMKLHSSAPFCRKPRFEKIQREL